MTLTATEIAYLSTQRLGRLATVAPDGTLQNSPVAFRYDPGTATIDISGYTMGASRKFRNVRENGEVAFVVDDIASLRPWIVRGVEIRGRAEALEGVAPPGPGLSGEIIRIHPRRVLTWGLDPAVPGVLGRTVGPVR
jgi:pyridoxamine 5'-phosphate oxidase family protein